MDDVHLLRLDEGGHWDEKVLLPLIGCWFDRKTNFPGYEGANIGILSLSAAIRSYLRGKSTPKG